MVNKMAVEIGVRKLKTGSRYGLMVSEVGEPMYLKQYVIFGTKKQMVELLEPIRVKPNFDEFAKRFNKSKCTKHELDLFEALRFLGMWSKEEW